MKFYRGCLFALPLGALLWLVIGLAVARWLELETTAAPAEPLEPPAAAPLEPPLEPPAEPMLEKLRARALTEDDATPALALRALAEADFAPTPAATVALRYPPQFADVAGGLPVVVDWRRRPVVGSAWSCAWLTQYVPSYPEGAEGYTSGPFGFWKVPAIGTARPKLRPDRACALLVTLRPPPEPQPIPGGAGGMLQVPPDYVLVPDRVGELEAQARPGRVIDFVQDNRGRMRLYVTWPRELAGLSVWLQLLVADPRVPAGCVPTPALELHVGGE